MDAYINRIATALPPHDIHRAFIDYAPTMLPEGRLRALFGRMAERSQIDHRYSFLSPAQNQPDRMDQVGFYRRHQFPGTQARMQFYEQHALSLACAAMDKLLVGVAPEEITHLLITSCTGFYAPGLDLQLAQHYGMRPRVERSVIGFMGCYAAISALKLARHIVRSEPAARVVILNIELCTLHLQETEDMEQILSFLIFGDGCAASFVSARPEGIALESFHCEVVPDSGELITWRIGEQGFDMMLSGQVPKALSRSLRALLPTLLENQTADSIAHWAIHPGGRSVLDAVQEAAMLPDTALDPSRHVLRGCGNMSSATVSFVLEGMLRGGVPGTGCAMAFGPGLTAETMRFSVV